MWTSVIPDWLSAVGSISATVLTIVAIFLAKQAIKLANEANRTAKADHDLERQRTLGSAVGLIDVDGFSWDSSSRFGILFQLADYSETWRKPRLLRIDLEDGSSNRYGVVENPWTWSTKNDSGEFDLRPIPDGYERKGLVLSIEDEASLTVLIELSKSDRAELRKAEYGQGVGASDYLLPKGTKLVIPLGQSKHVFELDNRPFTLFLPPDA